MSFATEFREVERKNGWTAKEDLIFDSLSQGISPAVRRLKKHTKGFFDELQIPRADEQKLDTGLQLGAKLSVVEKIGRRCGLGSVLSLLLGFELSRAFRMPYDSIVGLVTSTIEQGEAFAPIRRLADAYGRWWEECQAEYAVRFAKGHQKGQQQDIRRDMGAAQEDGSGQLSSTVTELMDIAASIPWACGNQGVDSLDISFLFNEHASGVGNDMALCLTLSFRS